MKKAIKAVYRQRLDGDWDFVAAFSTEGSFPQWSAEAHPDATIADLCSAIEDEGDQAKVIEFDEPDMPSVYDKGPDEKVTFSLSPKRPKRTNVVITDNATGKVHIIARMRCLHKDDMEADVRNWCELNDVRFNDCSWMTFDGLINLH